MSIDLRNDVVKHLNIKNGMLNIIVRNMLSMIFEKTFSKLDDHVSNVVSRGIFPHSIKQHQ